MVHSIVPFLFIKRASEHLQRKEAYGLFCSNDIF